MWYTGVHNNANCPALTGSKSRENKARKTVQENQVCYIGCCMVLQGVAWCCRVLQGFAGWCRVFWLSQSHAKSKHAKLCKRIRCVCVCIYVCERESECLQACASVCVYTCVREREWVCASVCKWVCARMRVYRLHSVALCSSLLQSATFATVYNLFKKYQQFSQSSSIPLLRHFQFIHLSSFLLLQVGPTSDFNKEGASTIQKENLWKLGEPYIYLKPVEQTLYSATVPIKESGLVKNTSSFLWGSFLFPPSVFSILRRILSKEGLLQERTGTFRKKNIRPTVCKKSPIELVWCFTPFFFQEKGFYKRERELYIRPSVCKKRPVELV